MHSNGTWFVTDMGRVMSSVQLPNDETHTFCIAVLDLNTSRWKGNGKLIAAAPRMLQQLKDTLRTLEDMTSAEYEKGADRPLRDALIELINEVEK